ncbi:MAG: sugar transferase [Deltaproteobacteria bacterium]|nr:sugar transferase [Deltaproteobacteria bacterium]
MSQLTPGFYSKLNAVCDIAVLAICYIITATYVGGSGADIHLVASCAFIGTVWFLGAAITRFYDPWARRDVGDDMALLVVLLFGLVVVLDLFGLMLPEGLPMPRPGRFLIVSTPALVALRLMVFRGLYASEKPEDQVLIVGAGVFGRETSMDLTHKGRRNVIGFLTFAGQDAKIKLDAPVLGSTDDIEQILKHHVVDEVYIAGNPTKGPEIAAAMQNVIKICERFGVPFALPAQPFRFDRAQPYDQQAVADGYLHYLSIKPQRYQMALKRLFDIVASSLGLWVLSPLLIGVAIGIKLTSRGPIFFKQQRVGLHGKKFSMLKFRSMVTNAEALKDKLMQQNEMSGPVFKMKKDPRITAIGRFIRKYSIDELPQLINVLRGDMSVVGPRPPVPSEVAKYESWQRRRLSVRPGLTCIWQVSGRNEISFEEWMYLDMLYVDNWSLVLDFSLILKTVPVVITGRGAS